MFHASRIKDDNWKENANEIAEYFFIYKNTYFSKNVFKLNM